MITESGQNEGYVQYSFQDQFECPTIVLGMSYVINVWVFHPFDRLKVMYFIINLFIVLEIEKKGSAICSA